MKVITASIRYLNQTPQEAAGALARERGAGYRSFDAQVLYQGEGRATVVIRLYQGGKGKHLLAMEPLVPVVVLSAVAEVLR